VDTVLKQRLIGAIVLVALAVIFLPMLVKGPAPGSGVADVPITAPPAPGEAQLETRELPLVAPGDVPSGGALGLGGDAGAAPATVQDTPPAAEPAAASATPLPAATAAGNYAVNFGAYASQNDADVVVAGLKKAQLPGFSEKAMINGRPAWRVRIGPYADQAQAESVRLQAVKVRSDVNARVVTLDASADTAVAAAPAAVTPSAPLHTKPLPAAAAPAKPVAAPAATSVSEAAKPAPSKPVASKPVATPVAPAVPAVSNVGFAVQLGAFGRAEDANALRDKVRAAGMSAFVEQVRTDKGTLNRVRVGPVANRAAAEQLKAQVAAKIGITGMVRPHP
jgi:cell division septation protein DedD